MLAFTLYTKPEYQPSWHHRLLCDYLDRFASGELRRLMVFMPPQHGKSELVSRRLPAYLLGRNPEARVIACSYSADLASRMNRDVQRIIDSEAYQGLFPQTQLYGRNNRNNAQGGYLRNSDLFEVVGHRGSYRSAGVGGGITGMSMDLGILDDPVKNREEADSPTQRDALWEWYTSTFYSRRSKEAGILLTMTRWNLDDLAGRILKLAEENDQADQWTVLKLPGLAVEPLGADDPRQPGEALWPDRYPLSELAKTRANSPYEFAALYQGDPAAAGGTEFPGEWFGPSIWFEDWPRDVTSRVIALDPSKGKEAKFGDYSAYVWLARDKEGVLWCEADLVRRPPPQLVDMGLELFRHFRAGAFVVEVNQFQELLAFEFVRAARLAGLTLPLLTIDNMVNKEMRIRRLGFYLANGLIRFKGGSVGTRLLVQQLKEFPVGDHDDGPDALEMALRTMLDMVNGRNRDRVIGRIV
jgi:predicted phage terminase large subunit-like protein